MACILALLMLLLQGIPALAEEGDALEVWVRSTYYDIITEAAAVFTEKTGQPVKVTQAANMSDDLALAISSGNTPDIVSIDCVLVPFYASIGAFKNVTAEVNALEYKDAFSDGALKLASYEGELYAVPLGPDVSVLIYNKELFAANGLDPESPPASWDELVKAAQACTNDECYGYAYPGSSVGSMMFGFCPYIWSNGGEFTSEDGSESLLNSPEAVAALQLYVDMIHQYGVTPKTISSYTSTEVKDAFSAQKIAMTIQGTSFVRKVINGELDFDAGVALIPAADGEHFSSFLGGDDIAILNDTDKADIAWQFVEYCLSEAVQVDLFSTMGLMPARADMFDHEVFQQAEEWSVIRKALEIGKAPYSLKYNELYTPFLDALQFAFNGEKTAQQAFDDAKAEIDAVLAE